MPALPHFIQVGDQPVLIGDGSDTLRCTCGQSVLVNGYRPGSLLAIGIQCFRCGEVTVTRGLAPGVMPPRDLRPVSANAVAVPSPLSLPAGLTVACETEIARADALARPADPPPEPLTLNAAAIEAWEVEYDRLSGGRMAEHRALVLERDRSAAFLPEYPLAWALAYLKARVVQPGWTWFAGDPDGAATAHLLAFRQFLACWSRHPLFPTMVAGAAAEGFSFHALAPFSAARAMVQAGNRVSFAAPSQGRIDGFAVGPAGAEGLGVTVQRFGRFEWPYHQPADAAAIRAAILDAMAGVQGRLNLKRPGVLVLSPGAVSASFDQPLVDGINAVLRTQGRRQRGITAVAAVLPKLVAARRAEQVGFAWSFYPIPNPHPAPGVAARLGSRDDFAGFEENRPG